MKKHADASTAVQSSYRLEDTAARRVESRRRPTTLQSEYPRHTLTTAGQDDSGHDV